MSSLSQFFFGSPQRTEQVPTVTSQQSQFLNDLLSKLGTPFGSGLQNLQQILSGAPEAFSAFEAPARQSFEQRTLPSIAERFTAAGGQRSSAFGQQLGQAGSDLETQLSAQRAGLQSQALQQLMGLLGQSQIPQFQNVDRPSQSGLLQGLLSLLGQIGGTTLTGGLGGLLSGTGFGSGIGRAFGLGG